MKILNYSLVILPLFFIYGCTYISKVSPGKKGLIGFIPKKEIVGKWICLKKNFDAKTVEILDKNPDKLKDNELIVKVDDGFSVNSYPAWLIHIGGSKIDNGLEILYIENSKNGVTEYGIYRVEVVGNIAKIHEVLPEYFEKKTITTSEQLRAELLQAYKLKEGYGDAVMWSKKE